MLRLSCCILLTIALAACSSSAPPAAKSPAKTRSQTIAKTVRITHIDHATASSELMLQSMSLIGTPYRFGGSNRSTGFDCSGMVQFVYRETLNVSLPRTAHDMAAAGKVINKNQLQVGDLVFFNTNGKRYSHVGLYIGENRFIHAPSRKSSIKINYLSDKYYSSRFTGARTFFVK